MKDTYFLLYHLLIIDIFLIVQKNIQYFTYCPAKIKVKSSLGTIYDRIYIASLRPEISACPHELIKAVISIY